MIKPNSGFCFNSSMCSHQTSLGSVASLAKCLIFSSSLLVHFDKISKLSDKFLEIVGLTANQQISRTPD